MMDKNQNDANLDFTYRAKESFIEAVKDPYFRDKDYDLIFDLLRSKMRIVPFGDYLKRYIYRKAELEGDYREIPLSEYQEIICDEFSERQVPCSFIPSSVRLRNAVKNWLEQQTVNRNIVLLLGFGLGMNVDDVNTFLTKALQENELNAKDPFEVLCWYCYSHGLSYTKFEALWQDYQSSAESQENPEDNISSTLSYKKKLSDILSEEDLKTFLATLPVMPEAKRQSVTARQYFDMLYSKARGIVACIMTDAEKDTAQKKAGRVEEQLSWDDRLYDFQKLQRINNERGKHSVYTEDQITPADIENVILSAVPKDKNGNLVSLRGSALEKQFYGKRLTRQRLADILSGTAPITRYDLLTLYFFNESQTSSQTAKERYLSFIHTANQMLTRCGFRAIYVANPYECFLLLCLLTDDPLGTYADVWELSYEQ